MTRRSQWLTLCILLGIWAGVAIWVVADAPEPQRVPLKYVTGRASRADASRFQAGAGLKVNLDLLAAARRRADKAFIAPKNIFAPLPTEGAHPRQTAGAGASASPGGGCPRGPSAAFAGRTGRTGCPSGAGAVPLPRVS